VINMINSCISYWCYWTVYMAHSWY